MKQTFLSILILVTMSANAGIKQTNLSPSLTKKLTSQMKKELGEVGRKKLKKKLLGLKGKSVPALISVMKNNTYPDKNRWLATFILGQIMGERSAPFISKFSKHPNWIMRMASLKTLLALKQKKYKEVYAKSLSDNSMLVRYQALDNIKKLNIKTLAPKVWAMLYDKNNYHVANNTDTKRTHIIKKVIRLIGDLKFQKAKKPLLSMIQKLKYNDIHLDIDYALTQITGKKSPEKVAQKKRFWKKVQISNTII